MKSLIATKRMVRAALAVALSAVSSVEAAPLNPATVNAAGRSVISRSKGSIGVHVAHTNGVDQVAIDTESENPTFQVKRLENPPRLVIDLTSQRITSSKTLAIADLDRVSSIRIGAQPTSGRIVMDLAEGQGVSHNVSSEGGKIVITLSSDGKNAVQPPRVASVPLQAEKPAVVPVKSQPRLPDVETQDEKKTERIPEIKIESAVVPASLNDEAKVASARKVDDTKEALKLTSAKNASDGEPVRQSTDTLSKEVSVLPVSAHSNAGSVRVKSVRLSSASGSSTMVAVDVETTPEFTIERTAPSEYVLTLKNSTLPESALSATLFSESQTASIRSVRSTARGPDALIRIFAQPEIYLTARVTGSQLIVEETKDLKQVVEDMRAQLAPKDTTSAVDKKEKAAPKGKDNTVAAKSEPVVKTAADEEMSEAEVQSLLGDTAKYTGKLISLDLQDTDIDNALRIIAEVSNLNIVASEDVVGKVTLRLTDVPWDQALDVILKTHALDKVLEGNVMRIAPVDKLRVERESLKQAQIADMELAQLLVKYIRVSYGKASELKSLVETVLSERGTVAYDERSNQLIVKDIQSGLDNVTELVSKVDLRTPQVLLETQIVEASRNLTRDLGSELGFQYIQSPSTGNGTGLNFPSAVSVGGTLANNGLGASAFPAAVSATAGSAVSMLFDSADGTKTLELRLTQLEAEGRVRIVSRPAVATTNNKPAEIKSVEKYRVRLPSGGTSVATGQGSTANGTGGAATEVIEAGIVLNVTPQASPDYYILLDIKAKSSTFGTSTVEGIPNEIERSASSSVLVSSGQTFALGGIYKLMDKDDVSGVPFLKDMPVLGTFFRRLQTTNTDEELLFFITPRIVEGSFDDSIMKSDS
jgi:type IV pilus secretin PilQ/predicted competence protein